MEHIIDKKIFICEDDDDILKELVDYFSKNNQVTFEKSFSSAKKIIPSLNADIILLDLLYPDGNGLDLIPLVRFNTPVIILSQLGSENSVITGLTSGACDYMVKPVSLPILEQRMLLRLLPEQQAMISLHGMKVSTRNRTCSYFDKDISLTSSEFDILYLLMNNAGKFFSSSEIYEEVWHMPSLNTGTVRYHIHNLREKLLNVSTECAALIVTKFGGGYAFRGE